MVSRKIILSIVTFLLINLPLNTSYADSDRASDIEALHNLKGIYVNLKIYDKTPQGIPRQRIDKKKLLNALEKELEKELINERGIMLFNPIYPHLNVKVIIEAQEQKAAKKYVYYVTVKASLERNAAEWYRELTRTWFKDTKGINATKKAVGDSARRLKEAETKYRERRGSIQSVENAKKDLASRRKFLHEKLERSAIGRTAEGLLRTTASRLVSSYHWANSESEYKKREREAEELSKQPGHEEKTVSLQQKNERYVESKNLSRVNVLYEIGSTIKLHNTSDTVVAIYKDESLGNLTNLFSNGIKASIIDYKALPDKPVVYRIKILLKDGSEYTGWISGDIISN